MKPVDVKSSTQFDFNKENNKENLELEFRISDDVRISKYTNIFAEYYNPNWSEEAFVIKKVKISVPLTYAVSDLNNEEIVGTFYEKELQKTNQKVFRIEKVINRKGDNIYIKWKWYNNSFNSWIDKKDIMLMSEYFPKLKSLGANVKVELDLSNYRTKADLKNATGA